MFVSASNSKAPTPSATVGTSQKELLVNPFSRKAPQQPEPLWKYVSETGSFASGGSKKWNCSFCNGNFGGSYSRVRAHLLGLKNQGIQVCMKVSADVKACMVQEDHESAIKKQKVNPSSQSVQKPRMQATLNGMFNATCRENVDEAVARCFYACGLPFLLAKSPYFTEMVYAISAFGKGYKPPSYDKLRTSLLEKEKMRVSRGLSTVESSWKHYGCSLISDGWTDAAKRPLINFILSSPRGIVFKGSIDSSGNKKTAEFIADALKNVVLDVGPEHIVQVVTDNAANCKLAGHLLELEFKHVFWTPCATHCLNLLLKDLANIAWMDNAIAEGKEVQQFITNHDATRAMFGKHSKLKLVRPGDTRFASHFMMLHRLVRVKTPLKHMVTCEEWDSWRNQHVEAKDIEATILSIKFWEDIEKYVKVCWPIMAMLRMVDKDDANMGVIFEGMDQMVEKIKEIALTYEDGDTMFREMNELIQARWIMMHSPLHATGFLLNPKWFSKSPNKDAEVMKGWRMTLAKVARDASEKTLLKAELSKYIGMEGAFGDADAKDDMHKLSPVSWWENYGEDTPCLQGLAIRILSQVSSASACERNWSTYGFIHSMKRNRLLHQMADDLVFVHSNLRLQSRREPSYRTGPSKCWDVEDEDALEDNIEEEMDIESGDVETM